MGRAPTKASTAKTAGRLIGAKIVQGREQCTGPEFEKPPQFSFPAVGMLDSLWEANIPSASDLAYMPPAHMAWAFLLECYLFHYFPFYAACLQGEWNKGDIKRMRSVFSLVTGHRPHTRLRS